MRRLPLPLLLALSCRPDLGDRDSLVVETQVLAVRGDPPEAKPGENVTYSVLVASPDGPIAVPAAAWAFCATPKLLTENGAVSAACLGSGVRPIGDGAMVSAPIPADACQIFGPETTSQDLRPRDPDPTGGFYQPVRVALDGRLSFGQERVRCTPKNISALPAADFDRRYRVNANPEIASVDLPDSAAASSHHVLRVTWPEASAETYAYYDPTTALVVDKRESMRVSWFANAGAFEHDRTGRTRDEHETFTENAWDAPASAGTVHLFVVLRDDRGGAVFAHRTIIVRR